MIKLIFYETWTKHNVLTVEYQKNSPIWNSVLEKVYLQSMWRSMLSSSTISGIKGLVALHDKVSWICSILGRKLRMLTVALPSLDACKNWSTVRKRLKNNHSHYKIKVSTLMTDVHMFVLLALQEIGRWMAKVKQFLNAEFMNKRLVFIRKSNDSDKVL